MTILDSPEPSFAAPDDETQLPLPLPSSAGSARLELRAQLRDGCAVIGVWGELFADSVGELTRLVDSLTGEGCDNLVLDVSRLYDLDADAVAELSRMQATLTARGGGLSLAAPRPWVRRLLESMRRRDAFPVHSTVADAIAQAAARREAG